MSSNINQAVYCAFCGGPLDYREDPYHLLYQADDPDWDDNGDMIPYEGPWVITEKEMQVRLVRAAIAPTIVTPLGYNRDTELRTEIDIDQWLADVWLIGKLADRSEKEWLRGGNGTRIFSQSEPPDNSDFFVRPAQWTGGYCIRMIDDGTPHEIDVYDHQESGFADFPVHAACLSIAGRVAERRRRQGQVDKPTSLEEMYEKVNSFSADSQTARGDMFPYSIAWPHGYYGAEDCQGQTWEWRDGTEWLCANPLNVPSLTEYILGRLRETTTEAPTRVQALGPAADDDGTSAAATSGLILPDTSFLSLSSLEVLPLELLCKLNSYLSFNSVLALSRTSKTLHERLLDQTFWRDALIAGDAIGYLWDLDGSVCRAKGEATAWDWRLLVRELARKDCFEDGSAFQDAPRSLKNRQRIWKCLEDI